MFTNSFRRTKILLTFVFAWILGSCTCTGWAQDQSFRMPEYAEGNPPPPRTRQEVAQLIAGADKSQSAAEESTDKPLRVVLVAGPKDHGKGEHDYPAWQKAWSRLLAEAPATTVDTAWEFPTPQQIDGADVLVFYQRGRWDDDRAAAIDPFLARGGGLVYIHWAVDGRGQQDEMAKRIGLSALGGGIRYRHGELNDRLHPRRRPPDRPQLQQHSLGRRKLLGALRRPARASTCWARQSKTASRSRNSGRSSAAAAACSCRSPATIRGRSTTRRSARC